MIKSDCPSNTMENGHYIENTFRLTRIKSLPLWHSFKVMKGWFIHGVSYLLPRVDAVADPCTSGLGTALTQGTIIHLDRKKIRKSDTTASLAMYKAAAAEHFTSQNCMFLTFISSTDFWVLKLLMCQGKCEGKLWQKYFIDSHFLCISQTFQQLEIKGKAKCLDFQLWFQILPARDLDLVLSIKYYCKWIMSGSI